MQLKILVGFRRYLLGVLYFENFQGKGGMRLSVYLAMPEPKRTESNANDVQAKVGTTDIGNNDAAGATMPSTAQDSESQQDVDEAARILLQAVEL